MTGHSPDLTKNIPGTTHFKRWIATISQINISFIYLGVIFILMIQSKSVVGIYPNSTALILVLDMENCMR